MHLIDRSPGVFIGVVGLVVYGVIGIEAWVAVSESYALLAVAIALILVIAALSAVFMGHLLDDASGTAFEDVEAVPQEEPAPAARPATPRRVVPGRTAHVA